MQMQVIVEGPFLGRSRVCEPILRALPQWFGLEEATNQYLKDIEVYPTFLAQAGDDVRGFLTLVEHNAYSAEIHVMGVHPEAQHRGVGGALVQAAECYLRQRGAEYLQVKTLSPRHPDKNYARTRKFYLAMGFRPLEEFPELWGPENPCLQMVKSL
jgi:GNAT superfamily N-acetyltransferase